MNHQDSNVNDIVTHSEDSPSLNNRRNSRGASNNNNNNNNFNPILNIHRRLGQEMEEEPGTNNRPVITIPSLSSLRRLGLNVMAGGNLSSSTSSSSTSGTTTASANPPTQNASSNGQSHHHVLDMSFVDMPIGSGGNTVPRFQRHQHLNNLEQLESGRLVSSNPSTTFTSEGTNVAQHQMNQTVSVNLPASEEIPSVSQNANPNQNNDRNRRSSNASDNGNNDQEESVGSFFQQLLIQNPEFRENWKEFEKYIPFVIMLLVKMLFDHGTGIIVMVCLVTTSFHANSVVKQQVGRQDRRNGWALLAVLVNLVACIVFIYFVFQDEKLYNCAIFLPPSEVDSFYELIWLVGVNDFILKFFAVVVKILLILSPARIINYQKRGKYFLFIERVSQLHRGLAPIQVWLVYLLNGYDKLPGKILGVMLTAAYMVSKGKFLLRAAKDMKAAVQKLLQTTSYGKSPSAEQVKATGGTCPICYDHYRNPTLLHCTHIFCEDCLSTWFDRERTCPLCRAKVTEDPQWRDGATSQFIQLF